MMPSSTAIATPKKFLVIAILFALLAWSTFVFLHQASGQSLPQQSSAAADITLVATTSVAKAMPILEVHIANNGIILLRYARVISITGNDIRVAMSLDTVDFTWLIQTSAYRGTTFLKSRNEKAELADIQVDDLITVNGKLVSSGAEPIIDAQIVRL